MARVWHPNVVRVHNSGLDEQGRPWLAMELVEGPSLAARLEHERTLPVPEAVRITRSVGQALFDVHSHGILHRDVKPDNVLLREGEALLTDFGLARAEGADRLTLTGQILGTPGYAAPELMGGAAGQPGPPADVYGLGATLYAMLTGAAPVQGESLQEILVATASARPLAPRALNASVSEALSELCLSCLEKDPAQRPTLPEFLTGLERDTGPPPSRSRRKSWLSLALAVGGLVVAGLAWSQRAAKGPEVAAEAPAVTSSVSRPPASTAPAEPTAERLIGAFMALERRLEAGEAPAASRIQARFEADAPSTRGAEILRLRLEFERGSGQKRQALLASIAPIASADRAGLGHYLRGRVYLARRRYPDAVSALSSAIGLRPEPLYRVYRIRGAVLAREWEIVEADLAALRDHTPHWLTPLATHASARYLLRTRRFAEGQARVRKLIADHGSSPERLGLLGRFLAAEGRNPDEAKRVLDLSLAGSPVQPLLWAARLRIPLVAGDAAAARRTYTRAQAALGKKVEQDAILVMAKLWVELLEGADAAEISRRLRPIRSKGPRGKIFKARIWLALGRREQAHDQLRRAIQSEVPRFVWEAEQLLAR